MKKIKTYNECNVDEKELLDTFRAMKLNYDQARFELYSYRLNDLIEKYEKIVKMLKHYSLKSWKKLIKMAYLL